MADSDGEVEFHPIELAAHSLLSGSLDNLHENFLQLHQSQHILLTRLKLIEDRLRTLESVEMKITEKSVLTMHSRVRALRKTLVESAKTLKKVEERVRGIEQYLES